MLCFEADLQVVRAGGEISLSASRWALAEAAIVADITAAVEQDLDSGDDFSDGADDVPDLYFSDDADDGGSATPAKQVRLAGQASRCVKLDRLSDILSLLAGQALRYANLFWFLRIVACWLGRP